MYVCRDSGLSDSQHKAQLNRQDFEITGFPSSSSYSAEALLGQAGVTILPSPPPGKPAIAGEPDPTAVLLL